ncbi:MAG: hypothetical protein R8K21_02065 [Mariprofundales bacterium]
MLNTKQDQTFVASLLYYLGALTMTNIRAPDILGEITLRIPN